MEPARPSRQQEMIGGWEALPAVFDGIEGRGAPVGAPTQLPAGDILDRAAVITALRELATVEHGLMVEYLYAYYSIDQDAFAANAAARSRACARRPTRCSASPSTRCGICAG